MRLAYKPKTKFFRNKVLIVLALALAGDIHPNPGPQTNSIFPCGCCQAPVTWSNQGLCCDGCETWYHKSCTDEHNSKLDKLNGSNVAWLCNNCDSINISNLSYHSFEFTSQNFYEPLSKIDTIIACDSSGLHTSLLDSSNDLSTTFNPGCFSSPKNNKHTPNLKSFSSTSETELDSNLTELSSFCGTLPTKSNCSTLNINCGSIIGKKSEFKALLNYTRPDIIFGCESWLKGIKPGKPVGPDVIANQEIFSDDYKIFCNDREGRGGGVFIGVPINMTIVECPEFVTNCEIEWVKINQGKNQDMYPCSLYMPHRDTQTLLNLDESLKLVNKTKPKNIIVSSDFNCPDVNWDTGIVNANASDKRIQEMLVEIMNFHNLTQMQREPTRQGNMLDLVFTSNPSLVKSSNNVPGISDHEVIITDFDIKPQHSKQPKRKVYIYKKANGDQLKSDMTILSKSIQELSEKSNTES